MPPATAILASSLLQSSSYKECDIETTWDLTGDIDTGVPRNRDESNIFNCGRVVGISGIQHAMSAERPQADDNAGDNIQVWTGELSLHIVANTLASGSGSDRSSPRALVVQYLDSRPISRDSLYYSMQQRLPDRTPQDLEAVVSTARIYQTFDFDEILDAVGRISNTLYDVQQQQPGHHKSQNEKNEEPILVVLEGIDRSLDEIIRISNPLAAQAKLMSLLRTLTILSRTYAPFVTVIVVNAMPLPPSTSTGSERSMVDNRLGDPQRKETPTHSNADQMDSSRRFQKQRQTRRSNHPLLPVQSIFTQAPPNPATAAIEDSSLNQPTVIYPSLLARSFDQGFDVHLLVSKVQGRMVIEVAKDRVGKSLGRWCAL